MATAIGPAWRLPSGLLGGGQAIVRSDGTTSKFPPVRVGSDLLFQGLNSAGKRVYGYPYRVPAGQTGAGELSMQAPGVATLVDCYDLPETFTITVAGIPSFGCRNFRNLNELNGTFTLPRFSSVSNPLTCAWLYWEPQTVSYPNASLAWALVYYSSRGYWQASASMNTCCFDPYQSQLAVQRNVTWRSETAEFVTPIGRSFSVINQEFGGTYDCNQPPNYVDVSAATVEVSA